MLLGLAACQKESNNTSTPKPAATKIALKSKSLVAQGPSYTDMSLVSPNTYQAIWHGVGVQVTGDISYDMVKYPTLVNGIPVLVSTTNISTYGTYAWLDSHDGSPDGNVFAVCVPILGGLPSPQFDTDYNSFTIAVNNWATGGGDPSTTPILNTYVQTSYSGEGGSITYTGKLIKVTTGSGLAIADVNYPLPATSVAESPMTCSLYDSSTGQSYNLAGSHNIITSATLNGTKHTVSASYSIDSVGDITVIGSIIRSDGSTFNFDTTFYV